MLPVIRRYLGRELMQNWLVFTLVLWLVLVTARFSLYLGQAASGQLPADTVLYLLGLKSVGFFVFLLPLTFFLALLWLLGRLNRDHETPVLGASGFGPSQYYLVLALPAAIAMLLVAILSLYLVPHSAALGYQLRADASRSVQVDALTPGRFHSLYAGRWLLYAQRAGAIPGELVDVFVHVQQPEMSQVLVAQRAILRDPSAPGGDRFLVLQHGHRYDGLPGRADYQVLGFDEYALKLQPQADQAEHKWDAVPSGQLWKDKEPAARAEWQMRLSRPLTVLVLFLTAIPLASFRPETGRYYPLGLGVLVFTIYFNLLVTAQLWLEQQRLPAWLGLWWVHALMLSWLVAQGWRALQRRLA
jgi:lipopolysaccharide export system permease protein